MKKQTMGLMMMLPLSVLLDEQLSLMDSAVAEPAPLSSSVPDDAWFLRRFWIRVRARAGVEIPGFVKLQVIPETEVLWERVIPDGWKTYKPGT